MNKIKCNPMVTEYTQTIINDYKVLLKKKVPDEIMIDTLDICHFLGEIERLGNELQTQIFENAALNEEIERLNNIINECMESVCYIEHNLEKYEEIGLDHFDYALNKTIELKEYLYEELKEVDKK